MAKGGNGGGGGGKPGGNTGGGSTGETLAVLGLVDVYDSGASSSDDLTNISSGFLLEGTHADLGDTVEIYINGAYVGDATINGDGTWTYEYTGTLSDGVYSVEAGITTTTGKGRDKVTETTYSDPISLTIDATAPDAPAIDSHAVNNSDVTLSGTAEADSELTVTDGTNSWTATADANGDWSLTIIDVADGSYSFTATATDLAGNESAESGAEAVTVGTPPPAEVPVITGFSADDGAIAGDVTDDATPIVNGTAAADAAVTVYVDGVAAGGTTADASGDWSLELGVLAEGAYQITASADGSAQSDPATINIDLTGPATPVIFSIDQDTGASATDYVTSDTTPNFSGTAEAGVTVEVFLNDGSGAFSAGTVVADGSGDWSLLWGGDPLVDGDYTVTVQATDDLGRSSPESAGLTLTIDATAPSAPAVLAIHDEDGSAQLGDETNDQTPDISGLADPGTEVEIWLDGTTLLGTETAGASGTWYYSWDQTFELADDSSHSITVISYDEAGNSTSSTPLGFIVNTPTLAAPVITSWGDDNGTFSDDRITNDLTPSLAGTAVANATIEIYVDDVLWGTTTSDASGDWSISGDTMPPHSSGGEFTYTAVARIGDDYSVDSNAITITIDAYAPTGTQVTGATQADDSYSGTGDTDVLTPDFRGYAEAGSVVRVYIDGALLGTTTADPSGQWTLVWPGGTLTDGASYTVTADATDLAGNVSSLSAGFTLTVDTTPEPPAPVPESYTPTDDLYAAQWHFGLLGDIEKIWAEYTGAGVNVGVYDNGVQSTHHQLDDNYVSALEFGGATATDGDHGTAVAGIIAAEADGSGTVGIAFDASLAGVNIITGDASANAADRTIFYAALDHMENFDVVNHSWGWGPGFGSGADQAERDDTADFYANAIPEFEDAVIFGRGGLGTILVKSAGNNPYLFPLLGPLLSAQDDALNVIQETIVVGAVAENGVVPYYSARGANLLISAPSEGNLLSTINDPVLTTDVTGSGGFNTSGDYTDFGGTSAAAPMVSGIVALMLEANPDLGWRDVQNILALTARHTGSLVGETSLYADESDVWQFNGADNWNGGGMHYSQDYGYGIVDAYAAVRMAEAWRWFGIQETSANALESSQYTLTDTVDPGFGGVSFTWNVGFLGLLVEYVEVQVTVADPTVDITITSAEGTVATLYQSSDDPGGLTELDWTFGVNTFRGEDVDGLWNVSVAGTTEGTEVTVSLVWHYVLDPADDVYHYTAEIFATIIDGAPGSMVNDASRTLLSDGDGGADWLNMAVMTGDLNVDLAQGGTSTSNGALFLTIAAGTDIENAMGGDGDDTLTGNALDNILVGMRGDDVLLGLAGADALAGGAGSNILTGGDGADIFYFTDGFAADLVTDLELGVDTINFADFSEVDNFAEFLASASDVGGDVVYDSGGDSLNMITFAGVALSDFEETDFDFGTVMTI